MVPRHSAWLIHLAFLGGSFLVAAAACGQPPAETKPAQEQVFSGPQEGEALGAVRIRSVFGEQAGQESELMEALGDGPVLLIFVNEITRPSVGLTRTLMNYAAKQPMLKAGVVFLTDDATDMTARLQRAKRALPTDQPLGISTDGPEGPGSYGLNRNVMMTVLVGQQKKVIANFTLVQPSLQVDAPKIAKAMHQASGGKGPEPTAKELGIDPAARGPAMRDDQLTGMLRRLIQKTNTPEQVAKAAAAIDEYVKDKPAAQKELKAIVQRINGAGRLGNYGADEAQQYLKKWLDK